MKVKIGDILEVVKCPVCQGEGKHYNPHFEQCIHLNIDNDCSKCDIHECRDVGEFMNCQMCGSTGLVLISESGLYFSVGVCVHDPIGEGLNRRADE
jgi:hypothetical protein